MRWVWLALLVLGTIGHLSAAATGGMRAKSAGECAYSALLTAVFAAWLFWGSGLF